MKIVIGMGRENNDSHNLYGDSNELMQPNIMDLKMTISRTIPIILKPMINGLRIPLMTWFTKIKI